MKAGFFGFFLILLSAVELYNIFVVSECFVSNITNLKDQSSSWEADSFELVKKFPNSFGTWRYINHVYKNLPLVPNLSQMNAVHTIPVRSFKIQVVSFLQNSYHNPICICLLPLCAISPAHLILFCDLITVIIIIDEEYNLWSFSLCHFLHSPVTSSLLGQSIFLHALFCSAFSLCSSMNLRDHVSHLFHATDQLTVLCILIFMFLDRKWTVHCELDGSKILLNIFCS